MPESTALPSSPYTPPRPRPRVALVIGAGGLKCAAALGLWRVLLREGISVDAVVGCSGGSIFGTAIALGRDLDWSEARTHELWPDLFGRYRWRALVRSLLPSIFGFDETVGLIDDRRVWEVLEILFGHATFADTRIPLFIAATDMHTGERVTLTEGRVADAVRASTGMPLVLPPWRIGGRLLTDGGVSNPLPIDVAIREGYEVIIAMGFENEPEPAIVAPAPITNASSPS